MRFTFHCIKGSIQRITFQLYHMKIWFGICISILSFFLIDYSLSWAIDKGLDKYFGLDKNAEILLIGHSHLMLATDKVGMEHETGLKVAKFCREGIDVIARKKMIEYYVSLPNKDSLQYVLYGVDLYSFQPAGLSANAHTLFYPFMDNPAMDEYIKNMDTPINYWSHKIIRTSRYSDALINSAIRGYMNNWTNYKSGHLDIEETRKNLNNYNRTIAFDSVMIKEFETTLSMLTDRGIHVILVNTPTIYELNQKDNVGYEKIISYFENLSDNNESIEFWDLNPIFSKEYELFFDMIHLNDQGQQVINDELCKRILSLRTHK